MFRYFNFKIFGWCIFIWDGLYLKKTTTIIALNLIYALFAGITSADDSYGKCQEAVPRLSLSTLVFKMQAQCH